jgi:hypothetical protein
MEALEVPIEEEPETLATPQKLPPVSLLQTTSKPTVTFADSSSESTVKKPIVATTSEEEPPPQRQVKIVIVYSDRQQ